MGLIAGAEPVTATLEKGAEAGKPSVVKAAAQAIVELARMGAAKSFCEYEAKLSATFRRCFDAQWDSEVQRALELAAGFCLAATKAA